MHKPVLSGRVTKEGSQGNPARTSTVLHKGDHFFGVITFLRFFDELLSHKVTFLWLSTLLIELMLWWLITFHVHSRSDLQKHPAQVPRLSAHTGADDLSV